jgi:hypothetical protein
MAQMYGQRWSIHGIIIFARVKIWFLFFLLMCGVPGLAQDTVRIDLKPLWVMPQERAWIPHTGKGRVAYLPLEQCAGDGIEIFAQLPFHILINNRLAYQNITSLKMPMRQLRQQAGETGLLAIYSTSGVSTLVCRAVVIEPENVWKRKASFTSTFLAVMGIALTGALIALVRINPAMAADYFSLNKTFSIRQTDDAPTIRLTSSSNLLYFVFIMALTGTLLFVLRNGSAVWWLGFRLSAGHTLTYTLWAGVIMLVKIVWVQWLGVVFGLAEFRVFQVQDYLRMMLASALFCSVMLLLFVILGIDWRAWTATLEYFLILTHAAFAALIYLKLMAQGGFTVFHLFSYLCLAEIIPLILLLKIYFS